VLLELKAYKELQVFKEPKEQ